MLKNFSPGTTPPEIKLVNLAEHSHPKLLDTSQVPSFDCPDEVEKYFEKVQMNYVFLRILMVFHLNIDDDNDTERADTLVITTYYLEAIMQRMLKKLFLRKMISEDTLLDTRDCLFDLLLEHPDLIEWYTDLTTESAQKQRNLDTADQDSDAGTLLDFLGNTSKPLNEKLQKILMDKLCGPHAPSDSDNSDSTDID